MKLYETLNKCLHYGEVKLILNNTYNLGNFMNREELVNKLIDSRLHTKARKLLELVYVDGHSQAEAARMVGVSPQVSSQYVMRFRKL